MNHLTKPHGAKARIVRCVVVAAVIACLIMLPVGYGAYWVLTSFGPSAAEIRSLQAEGQELVDAVERHRARTGHYPATLDEAGVSTPLTWYGYWRYGRSSNGQGFNLELGDYPRYTFVMWWDGKGWEVDT